MAVHAPITGAQSCAPDFLPDTTRRDLLGLAASAGALAASCAIASAVSAPLPASLLWDARDWMKRWFALGCGLEVYGNALHLKARLNGDPEAIGDLMTEIAPVERRAALAAILEPASEWSRTKEDPAIVAVSRIEQVDSEFVSEAVDPAASAAWLAQWEAEARKLLWTPASTAKGIAAKIRHGVSMHSELGDEIVERALAQLGRMQWR